MFPSLNKGLDNSEWSQPCHNKKKGSVNTLPDLKMTDQPKKNEISKVCIYLVYNK